VVGDGWYFFLGNARYSASIYKVRALQRPIHPIQIIGAPDPGRPMRGSIGACKGPLGGSEGPQEGPQLPQKKEKTKEQCRITN
jgi:hypothetical protein